jgi:hypothetical protein
MIVTMETASLTYPQETFQRANPAKVLFWKKAGDGRNFLKASKGFDLMEDPFKSSLGLCDGTPCKSILLGKNRGLNISQSIPSPNRNVIRRQRCSNDIGIASLAMDNATLDKLRQAYRNAVEVWIATIREEEALATPDHSVTAIDRWEEAGFREEEARNYAKAAKSAYEDALRRVNYNF